MEGQPAAPPLVRPWFSPGMRWIRRIAVAVLAVSMAFALVAVFIRRSRKAALDQAIKECGYCCEERKGDGRPSTGRPPAPPSPGAKP